MTDALQFWFLWLCTVTGAAVKKKGAAASTHSRATDSRATAFCDMHVNK